MATYPIKLQNGNDILLPITYAGLVQINDNGTTKSLSNAWDGHISSHASTSTYAHVAVDSSLSSVSTNPVQNKAVYNHTTAKASTSAYAHVVVDSSLNSASTNPVQNKAVYNHTTAKASTTAYGHVKVDDTLNNTSTNPVQNKVIYTKMIENEQTTAIGLAVLNSRLDTVEANSSQISNYISKSGSNKVDNDQEIHWSKYSGNIDGLHLTNSSIGWSSGQVNTGGIMTTYSVATFSRSGISIGSSLTDSGLHFNVSGSGLYTYVRVGGNNKISLETNGTAGQIVAPKFMENSDERLKTDIEKIANIGEINMYEFNMNGSHMYGFVAQDLEKTHPELVTTSSEDSGEINNVKSVDYNSSLSLVVSKLINKITELEERIKELEKK